MIDLETRLEALAPDIDWPATPQLSHRVLERVIRPPQRWYLTRWAVAAVAVVAAGSGTSAPAVGSRAPALDG